MVIGSRNWTTPAAELETLFFPQPGWVPDAIHERMLPLEGYRPGTNQTLGELARRARQGVLTASCDKPWIAWTGQWIYRFTGLFRFRRPVENLTLSDGS